jgi:hypothetical protein
MKNTNKMRKLSINELESVNGGVDPVTGTVVITSGAKAVVIVVGCASGALIVGVAIGYWGYKNYNNEVVTQPYS